MAGACRGDDRDGFATCSARCGLLAIRFLTPAFFGSIDDHLS